MVTDPGMEEEMSKTSRLPVLLIPSATVFFSSACIMVLEIVAGRLVARHLGSSLYTWTSVIGVVLAGITLGNVLGGRIADQGKDARQEQSYSNGSHGGLLLFRSCQMVTTRKGIVSVRRGPSQELPRISSGLYSILRIARPSGYRNPSPRRPPEFVN